MKQSKEISTGLVKCLLAGQAFPAGHVAVNIPDHLQSPNYMEVPQTWVEERFGEQWVGGVTVVGGEEKGRTLWVRFTGVMEADNGNRSALVPCDHFIPTDQPYPLWWDEAQECWTNHPLEVASWDPPSPEPEPESSIPLGVTDWWETSAGDS